MRIRSTLVLFFLFLNLTLWAQPANDECSGAQMVNVTAPAPCPAGTPVTTNISTNNNGATSTIPYPQFSGCNPGGGTNGPAAEVWYTFIAPSNQLSITVVGLSTPNIVLFTGSNCNFLTAIACAKAMNNSGNVTLGPLTLDPGQQYFILVSGADINDTGNFTLSFQASRDCDPCLNNSFLSAVPPPANGTYSSGTTVQFCYTITQWDVTGTVEWLHAVEVQFGPGWDMGTLVPIPPASCGGDGSWNWYDSWTSCNTGITYGPGFAYDSSSGIGCGGSPNDGNPGNNWGDGVGGCANIGGSAPPVTFCWFIQVADCPPNDNGANLGILVNPLSDGDSGSWTQTGCNTQTVFTSLASATCCNDPDPLAFATPTSCLGGNDGSITFEGGGGFTPGPWNYTVFNASGMIIYESTASPGQETLDNLPAGTYNIVATNAVSGCTRSKFINVTPGPPPLAMASTTPACPGEDLQVFGDVIPDGSTVIYQWAGPNGFSSNQQNPVVPFPGTYTLNVTVDGCPANPVMVNVSYLPVNTMAQASPTAICMGELITLTASGGVFYDWGPYGVGPTIQIPAPSVTSAEILTFTVDIQTANGCTDTKEVQVTVYPLPEAEIQGPLEACQGSLITLSASGGVQYEWSNGQAGPVIAIELLQLPLEDVFVTVTDAFGCQAVAEQLILVNPPPVVDAFADPDIICAGETTQLTAIGGDDYEWSTTQTGATISVAPTTSTIYEVTVTDANGCRNTTFVGVTVEQSLPAPNVQCGPVTPNSVTFTWNAVPGATGYAVDVLSGQPGSGSGTSYTVTGLSPGEEVIITVGAVGNNSCANPTTQISCFSQDCPPVGVSITPVADICLDGANAPIQLSVTITGATMAGDTLWSGPGMIDTLPGMFDPVVADTGAHEVILAYSEGDCIYYDTLTINIFPVPTADFALDTNSICTSGSITVTYIGTADSTATFTWDFDGGTAIPGTGPGPHTVSWANGGNNVIGLTVTENACISELFTAPASIQEPLPPPVISCGTATTTSVTFNWSDVPGATGYNVVVLSGQTGAQSGNSFTVNGLQPQEMVTIEVAALNTGPCGNSSAQFSCSAAPCPNFAIDIANVNPANEICLNANTPTFTLGATVSGGTGNGTGAWSGPGITDPAGGVFDPVAAGPGVHTITYTYTEGPCSGTETIDITIYETPSADFTLSADTVCINQAISITYTGTADPVNATFTWTFNGGTAAPGTGAGPHQVSWATAGTKTVSLIVEEDGCPSQQFTQTVVVTSPLPQPVINCNPTTSSVEFTWNNVPGAVSYNVTVLTGPPGVQNGNTYLVTGLNPGDMVQIQVEAVGTGPCGNSSATGSCIAEDCPMVTIAIDAVAPICLDASAAVVDLSATITGGNGGGTESWSGPGITDTSLGLFGPNTAGPGVWTINFNYIEGNCSYNNSIDITVNEQPTANFTVDGSICIDGSSTATYNGSAGPGATYTWDFGDATATPGTGAGPHELSWATGGSKTITLTVAENNCTSEPFTQTVQVSEPLATPDIDCQTTTSSILFSWPDVAGATGYAVTVLTGPTGTQTGNSYLVDGLSPGDVVRIEVEAIGAPPCGSSFAELECIAQDCPDVQITIAPVGPFCEGSIFVEIPLQATVTGGAGGGTGSWAGPGIIDPANGTFDPGQANIGTNTITYTYQEGNCSYNASLQVVINPQPVATFTADSLICLTQASTITYSGSAGAGATFNWDFDGGMATPGTGPGPHQLSWPSAGLKTVTLTVSENGCDSEPFSQEVQVDAPLAPFTISCQTDNTSILFSWPDIAGATGYQVVDVTGPTGILNGNTYSVTGLNPGDEITIQVVAETDSPCGNIIEEQSCVALDCPDVVLTIPALGPFCEDANAVNLNATATGGAGGGVYTWSGQGVVGNTFDPGAVPQAGDYTLSVQYVEGVCQWTASTVVTVNAVPTANFTVESPLCEDSISLVTYTGTASSAATYNWDFNGGIASPGTGPGPHQVSWNTAGLKTVSLTVVENTCQSALFTQTVEVEAPLPPLEINCVTTSTSIAFLWDDIPGATAYMVEVLNGGPAGIQDGTSYTFTGLTPGQEVTIQVTAVSGNSCSDVVATASCVAQDCPPLTATLTGPEAVCQGSVASLLFNIQSSSAGPFAVTYTVNGAAQTVTLTGGMSTLEIDLSETALIELSTVVDNTLPDCVYNGNSSFTVQVDAPNNAGSAGTSVSLCEGIDSTIMLGSLLSGADAGGQWQESSTSPSTGGAFNGAASIFQPGNQPAGSYTFVYTADNGGVCPVDQTEVGVVVAPAPVADAGGDLELTCNMGMVTLGSNNTSAGATYNWTGPAGVVIPNPNSQFIDVGQPGLYTLLVTNAAGCAATDEVEVSANLEVPTFETQVSQISCFQANDGVISLSNISGGLPPYRVSLNGGPFSAQTQFTSLGADDYSIVVQDANGCISELSINLEQPEEVIVTLTTNLEGENVIQLGDSVRLTAVYNPNISIDTILWQPDSISFGNQASVWVSPELTSSFRVTIVDENGCSDSDNTVIIVEKKRPIYIPNVFSPNEDGRNDVFYIQAGPGVREVKSFLIFNRWGEPVFENYNFQPNDPSQGWDGVYRGEKMNGAVFAYFAEIEFIDGEVILFKGDVMLMR
ncbi:MAG: gliding motility-associated C-terminal domain-containing protein [Lewinellaceae bacterium]|nr:gliding motility-associated C-terminal domain-containing protein [Lewinellaceae bacterium]